MEQGNFTEREVYELARQAYTAGCAGFSTRTDNCALLVIDMQDEFVRPGWAPFWVPEATKQVPKIKNLISFCRRKKIPVIFTVFADTHKYLDRPKSARFMANRYGQIKEDPGWFKAGLIWHELEPLEGDLVIQKPSYGAFFDTPLETILKNMGKDTVIICGTLTNFCCSTTARQAYERGFKVIFGSDVNAADDPLLHEMELMVLRKGFAQVLSHAEIMEKLSV